MLTGIPPKSFCSFAADIARFDGQIVGNFMLSSRFQF